MQQDHIQFAQYVNYRYKAYQEREEEEAGPFVLIKNARQSQETERQRLKQQRETAFKTGIRGIKSRLIQKRKVSGDAKNRNKVKQRHADVKLNPLNYQMSTPQQNGSRMIFTQSIQYPQLRYQLSDTQTTTINQNTACQLSQVHSCQPNYLVHTNFMYSSQQNHADVFNNEDSPVYFNGLPRTPQVKQQNFQSLEEEDIEQFRL